MLHVIVLMCLGVMVSGAVEPDVVQETVQFRIDNKSYFEKTVRTESHDIIAIPQQGLADRTIIVHDYVKELSAYKDVTAGLCFVSPFYRDVLNLKAVLFHYETKTDQLPGRVIKMVAQRVIEDIQRFAGQDIAELCGDLPALWIIKEKSQRTKRGAHVSACGSISVGKGGVSVSGSASAGSSSSSASAGSSSGGGFSCSGCGSVGVGGGGVSASGSVAGSSGSSSAKSSSSGGGSSSSSSGSSNGGGGWKRRR
ncbi:keratin, type II cytoskeletal 1b-like [Lineus longissimus]|uniref:keratin, type II cytoskeletal 1b-like n=1 Tax=Lineus longissimus TaxID=88925 RepID=UPI002B4CC4E9